MEKDPTLYPNADGGDAPRPALSRRTMLAGSAAAGVAATAGCLGEESDGGGREIVDRPTVFVFNTGDGTVSLIDVESDGVVATEPIGMTASFPSNQYSPGLTDRPEAPLWLNVDDGVRAVSAGPLGELAHVETGSGANWQEQTPDGETLVVSAREPAHRQYRIDADRDSETFGEVTGEIDRTPEGGRGDNDGPGPCDVTIHPDGEYAYVPDLFGDTLTVIDIEAFEIVEQVDVDAADGTPPEPWMGTAAWDGERMLVENNTGSAGTESIWDVSDPAEPVEAARLGPDDGFGEGPLTSEIGPESAFGYAFTPGTADVTVVDLVAGEVADRLDLGGSAFVGSWDPDRSKLYVPVQTAGEVAVIDSERREVVDRIEVGPEPYGATAATFRVERDGGRDAAYSVDTLTGEYETTYCIGECACGHEL
jgi:DNA-binding beta-propeller fold protein YncE